MVPELPPYRPPSEADSVLLRVTRGCPWNRCTFCGMYKSLRFELRPREDIERDVAVQRGQHPHATSLFLADADSLVHPELTAILQAAARAFPEAERITSYARLKTLCRLAPVRLKELRQAGLTRLHVGLESGAAEILDRVQKGVRPDQAIRGGRKALDAGFELSLYVLCGLGGEELWHKHADETARVAGEIWPHFLRLRTLVILPDTPLSDAAEDGAFVPASPFTRLRETLALTTALSRIGAGGQGGMPHVPPGPWELHLCSDHFSNMVWADSRLAYEGVDGRLPTEGPRLQTELEAAIARLRESRRAEDPASLARRGRLLSVYRAHPL